MSVCKEHQPKLAQDQIKVFIWKWELLRGACVPFHCNLIPFRRDAGHVNHVWIDIEANDDSPWSNMWSNVASDNPCAASYIQYLLARLRIRTLNKRGYPRCE
jgi:hypothetical protein